MTRQFFNNAAASGAVGLLSTGAMADITPPELILDGVVTVAPESGLINIGDAYSMHLVFNTLGTSAPFGGYESPEIEWNLFVDNQVVAQGAMASHMGVRNGDFSGQTDGFNILWDDISVLNGTPFSSLNIGINGTINMITGSDPYKAAIPAMQDIARNYEQEGEYSQLYGKIGDDGFWADINQVTYVPTPASAALLGLGGVVAARRRRAPELAR